MSIEHRELVCGSKSLSLDVNLEIGNASVRFGTRYPRWLFLHRANETTAVFRQADQILRDLADRQGAPITLRFDTANLKLKLWVEAKKKMLGFDSVDPDGTGDYRITITKKYPL
jgi:hypothetical protein